MMIHYDFVINRLTPEKSHGTIKFKTYIQYLKMGTSLMIAALAFGVLIIGEVTIPKALQFLKYSYFSCL